MSGFRSASLKRVALQANKTKLLEDAKKKGWRTNTPPPIWQVAARKQYAAFIKYLNNVSIQLKELETLENNQKQTVEKVGTAARDRMQAVWSAARRTVELKPGMSEFMKQNKRINRSKQVRQKGAQDISL
ncbi:MAG: hypothetical protein WBI04_04890 [Trichlorobacter sp.]